MLTADEERQLKEILYLLVEKVRATKAALYLAEPNGSYALAASYGFGRTDRFPNVIQRSDPMARLVNETREPRYANDYKSAGVLAPLMEAAASTRILTAPLYLEGRIIGILDVRDKAGRDPFQPSDVELVKEILGRLAARALEMPRFQSGHEEESEMEIERGFTPHRVVPFGPAQAASPVDSEYSVEAAAAGVPKKTPDPALSELSTSHLPSGTARLQRMVEETLARPAGSPSFLGSRRLREREESFSRLYLGTCLHLPDVEVAAISVCNPRGVEVMLASARALSGEFETALLENVQKVFARAGAGFTLSKAIRFTAIDAPATPDSPILRSEIAAIQSSVLKIARDEVAILSLVFRHGPAAESREGLQSFHLLVKTSLDEIRSAGLYRESYKNLVNKLLEPGLKKYSALKSHSFNVGRMARKLAGVLRLAPLEIEQITVAAILHDIGMKELNYDELYAKRALNEEELRLLREHPSVGAFLLDEIPWPYPIAPLVRHHHERWDGAGYPGSLRGDAIPFGARLIHVCEAFDAMTSPASYRAVISVSQALEILTSKRGTQFDPEIVPAFRSMVEGMKPAAS